MTEAEHAKMVKDESEGRLLVGIDRSVARRFYTEMCIGDVEAATGETPYAQKFIVLLCFYGVPLALLVAVALSVMYFHWWSAIIVPAFVICWFQFHSASSVGGSRLEFITLALAATAVVHAFNPLAWTSTLFFLCVALAFWFSRCLYVASTGFLRVFVIRNYRAFNLLGDAIVLQRVEFPSPTDLMLRQIIERLAKPDSRKKEDRMQDQANGVKTDSEMAKEELFDWIYCQPNLNAVLLHHECPPETLDRMLQHLVVFGAGQWVGNYFVAAASLTQEGTLGYLLKELDAPLPEGWSERDRWSQICFNLIEFYRIGKPVRESGGL